MLCQRSGQHSVHIAVCILSAIALLFAGCKEEEPETLFSDKACPTWTAPAQYDYTSSMTAVVKVDLKVKYPAKAADFVLNDQDLLAAFSDNICLGTASPQEGLFFLYITGTEGAVTLRYYSAHYKNLFEAPDAFVFSNDAHLGSVSEPVVPTFVESK